MPATSRRFINLWVSDDDVTYSWGGPLIGGELQAMSWVQQGKPTANEHIFHVNDLHLAGRYVKFSAYRATQYMFCDEIEVLEGDFDPATVTPSLLQRTSGFENPDKIDPVVRIRMMYDLDDLEHHSQAAAFASQLASLRSQIINTVWISSIFFENGLPYTTLHENVWKLNGQMNRAAGLPEFSIAPSSPYALIKPFDTIVPDPCDMIVHMMGNEKRSAAVNISNFSDATDTFDVRLNWEGTGFPDGDVTLNVVRFTEAQRRWICSYALPKISRPPSQTTGSCSCPWA